jgi:hypothetical protein
MNSFRQSHGIFGRAMIEAAIDVGSGPIRNLQYRRIIVSSGGTRRFGQREREPQLIAK